MLKATEKFPLGMQFSTGSEEGNPIARLGTGGEERGGSKCQPILRDWR